MLICASADVHAFEAKDKAALGYARERGNPRTEQVLREA